MADIYDSMNNYFEKTYGDLDGQASKKPLKESKGVTSRRGIKESVDCERCKDILNNEIDWDKVDETGDVDFARKQLRSLATEGSISKEEYDYIVKHWDDLLVEGRKLIKKGSKKLVEEDKAHPVAQALTDAGIKMDGDISSPAAARVLADKVISVLKVARDTADKKNAAQFTKAIDIISKRRNSPALLLSTLGTYYTKIKAGADSDKKDECVSTKPVSERMSRKRKTMKEARRTPRAEGPYYEAVKRVVNGDEKAARIVWDWVIRDGKDAGYDPFEDSVEDFEDSLKSSIDIFLDTADDDGFDTLEHISVVAKALGPGYEDWIFTEDCNCDNESLKHTPKLKINRKKVESLKSAPKRHSLKESRKIVSRKALKEALGAELDKYQKWVDYDMKRYHRISGITNQELKKAGLTVTKNDHGDYEVITESKSKALKECNCDGCTCDGVCTCTDDHSCCGKGEPSHEVIKEAPRSRKAMKEARKPAERDLWETIYGELTDDGSQRFNKETGHTYFNKGAGYDYGTQIAVDRAGNIVVKVAQERDLKAAIDIADKHKAEGVTYNISESKYDKKYPIWMTIEIPFEDKEDLDESKLTEKRWSYVVSDNVSREFRDAVLSDDEDFERVRKAMIAVYDDIHENAPELLDDDDYDSWVTEELEVVDFDDMDDVNYELAQLYDFCDNVGVFIGI